MEGFRIVFRCGVNLKLLFDMGQIQSQFEIGGFQPKPKSPYQNKISYNTTPYIKLN